ncbi:MAG: hypothetical protein JNL11_11160 [Bdellovibrionaceae bacterium]|nr:hypothetical protein [Pseudobdellovibrionaceae bacterium]
MKISQKKIRPSIKRDRVSAFDYQHYDHRFSCEECTHFNHGQEQCTLGYVSSHHRKSQQAHDFELSGSLAFCRFHEID